MKHFKLCFLGLLVFTSCATKMVLTEKSKPNKLCAIKIVTIDKVSENKAEGKINREYFAQLIKKLSLGKPKVIVLKFLLDIEGYRDDILASEIKAAGNVILEAAVHPEGIEPGTTLKGITPDTATNLQESGLILVPTSELSRNALGIGIANVCLSKNDEIESFYLVVKRGEKLYPSLALVIAAHLYQTDLKVIENKVIIGNKKIPFDSYGRSDFYLSKPGALYEKISSFKVLEEQFNNSSLENSIVIIALSEKDTRWFYFNGMGFKAEDIIADTINSILTDVMNN